MVLIYFQLKATLSFFQFSIRITEPKHSHYSFFFFNLIRDCYIFEVTYNTIYTRNIGHMNYIA